MEKRLQEHTEEFWNTTERGDLMYDVICAKIRKPEPKFFMHERLLLVCEMARVALPYTYWKSLDKARNIDILLEWLKTDMEGYLDFYNPMRKVADDVYYLAWGCEITTEEDKLKVYKIQADIVRRFYPEPIAD